MDNQADVIFLYNFFPTARALKLNSNTARIKTAEAPAETASPSGIVPSEFIFQMCTANVSACRNKPIGLETLSGFQLVKSKAGALCPAV